MATKVDDDWATTGWGACLSGGGPGWDLVFTDYSALRKRFLTLSELLFGIQQRLRWLAGPL